MRITTDISAVRQSSWQEIALRFVCGGSITVIAALVAQAWGPTIGGLFLAFPAIFPAGATLLERHEKDRKAEKGLSGTRQARGAAAADAAGAVLGSLGLMGFAVANWRLLQDFDPAWVIPAATLAWGALAFLMWTLRQHHTRWSRPRLARLRAIKPAAARPVARLKAHGGPR